MGIKDYYKKNIQKLQKSVENNLEIKLGDIYLKTKSQAKRDYLEYLENNYSEFCEEDVKKEINNLIYPKEIFISTFFPQNIYYSKFLGNLSFFIFGKETATESIIHELCHLAHLKIVGKKKLENTPKKVSEGFATYFTREIFEKQFKMESVSQIGGYGKYYNFFKEEVKKRNLKTAENFKQYLKSF